MTTTNLKEHSILVSIENHCFNPSRTHKGETAKVRQDNQASKDAVHVIVKPIPKDFWGPIKNAQMEIIRWRDLHTLPWSKGFNILPIVKFDMFTAGLRERLDAFYEIRNAQMHKYSDLVANAPRDHVGKLYNPEYYPPHEVVRSAFDVEVQFIPVPDREDYRLQCTEDQLKQLVADNDKHLQTMHKQIVETLHTRLYKAVAACSKALHPDTERIHESVFETLHELVEDEPSMNLVNDAGIHSHYQVAKRILLTRTVDTYRNDDTIRGQVHLASLVILGDLKPGAPAPVVSAPVVSAPAPLPPPPEEIIVEVESYEPAPEPVVQELPPPPPTSEDDALLAALLG